MIFFFIAFLEFFNFGMKMKKRWKEEAKERVS